MVEMFTGPSVNTCVKHETLLTLSIHHSLYSTIHLAWLVYEVIHSLSVYNLQSYVCTLTAGSSCRLTSSPSVLWHPGWLVDRKGISLVKNLLQQSGQILKLKLIVRRYSSSWYSISDLQFPLASHTSTVPRIRPLAGTRHCKWFYLFTYLFTFQMVCFLIADAFAAPVWLSRCWRGRWDWVTDSHTVRFLITRYPLPNWVNSVFHPSGVGKSTTSLHGWGLAGPFTCVG